jgi:serine/threonine-protein kinase
MTKSAALRAKRPAPASAPVEEPPVRAAPEKPAAEKAAPEPEPEVEPAAEDAAPPPEPAEPAPEEPAPVAEAPAELQPLHDCYQPIGEPVAAAFGSVRLGRTIVTGGSSTVRMIELRSDQVSAEQARRILRRVEAMRAVSSPALVPILDIGVTPDGFAYVEGSGDWPTLREFLSTRSPLSCEDCARLGEQLAAAIELLSSSRVFHRNITPTAIVVEDDLKSVRLRGLDLAVCLAEGMHVKSIAGTLNYMAPEALSGDADQRADIYSAGVVMFEALTGRLPVNARSIDERKTAMASSPAPAPSSINPAVSAELDQIVLTAMAMNPDDRRLDADSFRSLAAVRSG